jgi:hypothetical protein
MSDPGFKQAAQLRKAMALVARCDRELMLQGVDPFDQAGAVLLSMMTWTQDDWKRLADAADVHPPSIESQELVRSVYRDRSRKDVTPRPRFAS